VAGHRARWHTGRSVSAEPRCHLHRRRPAGAQHRLRVSRRTVHRSVRRRQLFQLSGTGTNLGFLTTATYGPASGTGTITYTDGTTQQFTLSVPDWYQGPPRGSDPAISMSYRNRSGNTQLAHGITVFLVIVPLQAGKTPQSVTLPGGSGTPVSGSPAIHVFGIAVDN
jgi:hypothetical protein